MEPTNDQLEKDAAEVQAAMEAEEAEEAVEAEETTGEADAAPLEETAA